MSPSSRPTWLRLPRSRVTLILLILLVFIAVAWLAK